MGVRNIALLVVIYLPVILAWLALWYVAGALYVLPFLGIWILLMGWIRLIQWLS